MGLNTNYQVTGLGSLQSAAGTWACEPLSLWQLVLPLVPLVASSSRCFTPQNTHTYLTPKPLPLLADYSSLKSASDDTLAYAPLLAPHLLQLFGPQTLGPALVTGI